MNSLLQNLIDGLSTGSLIALFSLGVALLFGIMRLINFAHGELIMVAAYVSVIVGAPLLVVLPSALIAATLTALLMERIAFRPIRSATATTLLVASFAVSFGLQNLAVMVLGSQERSGDLAPSLTTTLVIGGLRISALDLVATGVTLVLLVALALLFTRTTIGIRMRAAAEDFETARMLGVRANQVIALAFALSGTLAAVGALLLVSRTGNVVPNIGTAPVLAAFVATVIGGVGVLRGAVIGGYLLGLVTILVQAYLPLELRYYRDGIAYAAVLLFLVFRPRGIFTGASSLRDNA